MPDAGKTFLFSCHRPIDRDLLQSSRFPQHSFNKIIQEKPYWSMGSRPCGHVKIAYAGFLTDHSRMVLEPVENT